MKVSQVAHHHSSDIDVTKEMQSKEWDQVANVCILRATTALRGNARGYTHTVGQRDSRGARQSLGAQDQRYVALPGGTSARALSPHANLFVLDSTKWNCGSPRYSGRSSDEACSRRWPIWATSCGNISALTANQPSRSAGHTRI